MIITAFAVFGNFSAGDESGERFDGPMDKETAALIGLDDEADSLVVDSSADTVAVPAARDNVPPGGESDAAPPTAVSDSARSPVTPPPDTSAATAGAPVPPQENRLELPGDDFRPDDMEGREMTVEIASEFPPGHYEPRMVGNNAWGTGEELVFSIDYGFISAGTATMSVKETLYVNGGECYHIQTTAHSNDFVSAFYKVRDRVDSYIDMKGLFTRRFEKRLREGGYESDRFVDFYHNRLVALNTQEKYAVTSIPLYVQDVLSSLYLIRTFDLVAGKTEIVQVYADGKVYPLKIIVHGKEKIKVPAGTFTCYKVEPKLQSEGIFKQKGKLLVWMTDDSRRMPVKMTSKIAIGSIGTNLVSYQTGEL